MWGLLHRFLLLNLLQPGEVFADLSDSNVSDILVIFEVAAHNSLLTKVALLSLIQHLLSQTVNFLSIVELKVVKLADVEYSLRVTSTWAKKLSMFGQGPENPLVAERILRGL